MHSTNMAGVVQTFFFFLSVKGNELISSEASVLVREEIEIRRERKGETREGGGLVPTCCLSLGGSHFVPSSSLLLSPHFSRRCLVHQQGPIAPVSPVTLGPWSG